MRKGENVERCGEMFCRTYLSIWKTLTTGKWSLMPP